ncbi:MULTISPECIES: FbpB family small basic protein [Sporolactobacillus]|uniref:Fur-regulated basic protein B n=1 Tax=Sporolactobacillus nakayamae TaxID=269670 RepID=A0A1I2PPP7_9BACL|nr:FbpB family small basic protein [Sporolactobacillus nakayamae]SFG18028.1 Fur-regulated basic protein B [Sporolactobacillus nakayamae]
MVRRRFLSFNKLVQQNISEMLSTESVMQALEAKLDRRRVAKLENSKPQSKTR